MAIPTRIEPAAAAVALLVTLGAGPAQAEAPHASLIVTRGPGAEDCPDAAALTARVQAVARTDALGPSNEPDTYLRVELLHELAGYRAVITARGRRQGARTIDDIGTSCGNLAEAVAITLVMLLDPELTAAAPAPLPPKLESPAPAPVPTAPAAWLHPGAEISGGATIGVLRHADPLLEAGARLGFGSRFALAAGGGYVPPDGVAFQGGSVKLDLIWVYVRGSVRLLENRGTTLALLGGPSLGSLGGDSSGFERHSVRHFLWSALALGAEAYAPLTPPFSWSARLLVLAPLFERGFSVVQAGTPVSAFRTSPVGGTLSVGLGAEL